jgi:hypothetical protein
VVTGIWLIVMHWLASGLGGYLTGRLRTKWAGLHTDEVFFRDTANGFLSWAVASVVGVVIVVTAAVFVVGGTTAVVTGVAGGAAKGAMQSATAPSGYLLDRLFRTDRQNAAGVAADAKAQTSQIILNSLATGTVSAPDKAYLIQLVSTETGVPPAEATSRVDQVIADAKTAEVKVQQAADAARKAGVTLTLFTGLAMLIGAFIACATAALGGKQRDLYE